MWDMRRRCSKKAGEGDEGGGDSESRDWLRIVEEAE
jgi:hypothetical protein